MMENDEMIYTAIFRTKEGKMTRSRYTGVIARREAWIRAQAMGQSNDDVLVALVPGDHPVYTYESLFENNEPNTELKDHDLYDFNVFEMT